MSSSPGRAEAIDRGGEGGMPTYSREASDSSITAGGGAGWRDTIHLEDQNGEGSSQQMSSSHAGAGDDTSGSPGCHVSAPRWSPIIELPIGRCGHTAVVMQGSLYVFGGFSSFRDLHQFNIGRCFVSVTLPASVPLLLLPHLLAL